MIVRTIKDRRYTVINNTVIEDTRLSWRARGIAAYLLTKPDDWAIKYSHLWENGKEGRDAVLSALNELEVLGYLQRVKTQDPAGRWSTEIVLHEVPQPGTEKPDPVSLPEEPTTDKPTPGKPTPGLPTVGFPVAIVSTDYQVLIPSTTTTTPDAVASGLAAAPPAKRITPQQELFGAVCEATACDHHTLSRKDKDQVAQTCGVLTEAGYGADDVRRFMLDHWYKDWRWLDKSSYPTLRQLRQEIGKVRAVVPETVPRGGSHLFGKPSSLDESAKLMRMLGHA